LLIDCDEVVRRYDPAVNAGGRGRPRVPAGTVLAVAMDHPIVHPAVTGRRSRAPLSGGSHGQLLGTLPKISSTNSSVGRSDNAWIRI
jgi:hypothetical protein